MGKARVEKVAAGAAVAGEVTDPLALIRQLQGMADGPLDEAIAAAEAEAREAIGRVKELRMLKRMRDARNGKLWRRRRGRAAEAEANGDGEAGSESDGPPADEAQKPLLTRVFERLDRGPAGIATIAADLGVRDEDVAAVVNTHRDIFRQRSNGQWTVLNPRD